MTQWLPDDPASLLALVLTGAALAAFVVLGWKAKDRASTLTGFFLTSSVLSKRHIVSTLAATNTALALTIYWHSFLGWSYGMGAAVWLVICWILGFEVFAFLAPRFKDFPGQVPGDKSEPRFQTVHEYMTQGIPGDWSRRGLALISIATFLLMTTVELTRGATIFRALSLPGHAAIGQTVVLLVIFLTAFYAAVGGFSAVMRTDFWQWILAAIAVFASFVISVPRIDWTFAGIGPSTPSGSGTSPVLQFLLLPSGVAFILGSLFSWGFWFLVTMDMWQRGAAARSLFMIDRRSRLILYPWFALLSTTSVMIGLVVRTHDPGVFQAFPVIRFLEIVRSEIGAIPFALIFLGFIAAIISTVDTYFLVITHCIFRDLSDSETRGEWQGYRLRRWVVGVAVLAVGLSIYPVFVLLANSKFDINALVYIATSLPFVLLPFVLVSTKPRLRRPPVVRMPAEA
jgi:Na+/proline symporter